jgi:hypothetical protein
MSVYALKALVNHSLGGDVTAGYVQHSVERLRVPAQRVARRAQAAVQDRIAEVLDQRSLDAESR